MKLYATVTSEWAGATQGGNEYLDIEITDCNKEKIGQITVLPFTDTVGDGIEARVKFAPHVYVNGENEFHFGRLSERDMEHKHEWVKQDGGAKCACGTILANFKGVCR